MKTLLIKDPSIGQASAWMAQQRPQAPQAHVDPPRTLSGALQRSVGLLRPRLQLVLRRFQAS